MKYLWILLLAVSLNVQAKIGLPAIIGSNMVLQRNTVANIWGTATAGKRITVKTSWNNRSYAVTTDASGNWNTGVQTLNAGGPYSIIITGDDKVVLDDVLIGEVWISSGQSNMEMPITGYMGQSVEGSMEEILNATQYPGIRMFTVAQKSSEEIQRDCKGEWKTSNAESVGQFSAVAYFYAKQLYKALGIPIGIVTSNWGGSTIEAWMPKSSLNKIEGLDMKAALSGTYQHTKASLLYNGMIAPIVKYTAKGFIWYQGESNLFNNYDYAKLMVALVDQWRSDWRNNDMYFYYVQLAPYVYDGSKKIALPLQIEAQYKALGTITNAGIAATNDLGDSTCIHPAKKKEVGARLAFLALEKTYNLKGYPVAPTIKDVVYNKNKVLLSFHHVPKAHSYNDMNSFDYYSGPLSGFEVAGADRKFYPARANHVWWKNEIEVQCADVKEPVAVRYGFRNCIDTGVRTTMGMPLVPFRTDNWNDVL